MQSFKVLGRLGRQVCWLVAWQVGSQVGQLGRQLLKMYEEAEEERYTIATWLDVGNKILRNIGNHGYTLIFRNRYFETHRGRHTFMHNQQVKNLWPTSRHVNECTFIHVRGYHRNSLVVHSFTFYYYKFFTLFLLLPPSLLSLSLSLSFNNESKMSYFNLSRPTYNLSYFASLSLLLVPPLSPSLSFTHFYSQTH